MSGPHFIARQHDLPRQNRVDPFSTLHAASERGLFTGNRGILHDPLTGQLKHQRWASESWVICALHPRWTNDSETVPKGTWTALFFLDEAVGLAAGHRPCHGCRKAEAAAFRHALGVRRVREVNDIVNAEMKPYLRARAPKPRPICNPRELPDGAFFTDGTTAFLKHGMAAFAFHFGGYGPPRVLRSEGTRLTPEATCRALAGGYKPVLHPSFHAMQNGG